MKMQKIYKAALVISSIIAIAAILKDRYDVASGWTMTSFWLLHILYFKKL